MIIVHVFMINVSLHLKTDGSLLLFLSAISQGLLQDSAAMEEPGEGQVVGQHSVTV